MLLLKENLRIVSQEKQTTCNLLDLEKNKSDKLEHDLIEYKKKEVGLQSEITEKEKIMESMRVELEQLKNTSSVST